MLAQQHSASRHSSSTCIEELGTEFSQVSIVCKTCLQLVVVANLPEHREQIAGAVD